MPNAVKKRRLTDLFQTGKPLTIGDSKGDIEVYVQKLNPVEGEQAIRRSNAARATYLAQRSDRTSEVYLSALNELMDLTREELLEFAVADELAKKAQVIEAEIAGEEGSEWGKDQYLQGLFDAWEGGVKDDYASDPEDPTAKKVFDELARFNGVLEKRYEQESEYLRREFANKSEDQLRDLMLDRITRMQADLAWMIEYRKSEIWLGVRVSEEKSSEPYFDTREEIDRLNEKVLTELISAFASLNVEVDEGKDLPQIQNSSSPSNSQETQETINFSSPEE